MPNQKKITIKDVARHAGVSISSVSRALSEHPYVSPELRAKVNAAAQALGYEPDFLAHSLRRGDTLSVGFLVGAISNPIMADIYTSASNVLAAQGYAMLLACSQNDPALDVDYLHLFARRQVSGLILSTAANGPDRAGPLITTLGLPAVMLDRRKPDSPHVSAVQSDHASGVKAAVQHLLAQRHRRIAMIGGARAFDPANARLAGFYSAFREANLPLDEQLVRATGMSRTVGYNETRALFTLAAPPTALIAGGNLILAGVLEALHELKIAVGRDVALVGCDDGDLTRLHTPSITVIARDLAQLGETAANLLLEILNQGESKTALLPTQLLVRESSLCSPK